MREALADRGGGILGSSPLTKGTVEEVAKLPKRRVDSSKDIITTINRIPSPQPDYARLRRSPLLKGIKKIPHPPYSIPPMIAVKSIILLENPHSLSYQETTRQKFPSTTLVCPKSKLEL